MHELDKLAEARYFHSRMVEEENNSEAFFYNLSAFLSSSRSVLQYALDEARTKTDGQEWYDKHIAKSPILSFFKDKRDINIHSEPVKLVKHASVDIKATVYISTSLHIKHFDARGNLLSESHAETPKPRNGRSNGKPSNKTTIEYRFDDWTGTDDVITLSQMYIDELQLIVEDGVQKGFISG